MQELVIMKNKKDTIAGKHDRVQKKILLSNYNTGGNE